MWQDPIVEDTRAHREQLAAKIGRDMDALLEHFRTREQQTGKQIISFPARIPKPNLSDASRSTQETDEGSR
jgi:hypothetical protein